MAIGPIENAIYVNQQMAGVASEKNAVLNRFELQALWAESQKKEKEIDDVRHAPEARAIDSDHAKEQPKQEERRTENEKEAPIEETPVQKPLRLLDIKV